MIAEIIKDLAEWQTDIVVMNVEAIGIL